MECGWIPAVKPERVFDESHRLTPRAGVSSAEGVGEPGFKRGDFGGRVFKGVDDVTGFDAHGIYVGFAVDIDVLHICL